MMCKLGGDQFKCDPVSNGDGNIARENKMLISFVFSESNPFLQVLPVSPVLK